MLTIDWLRSIEWARSYKWEVEFLTTSYSDLPAPPAPFNEFFPASDVDFGSKSINTSAIESPIKPAEIPFGTDVHHMSITFYDNDDYVLMGWLEDWMKAVNGGGKYVLSLTEASLQVNLRLLNSKDMITKEYALYVFPMGEVKYAGTSESGVAQFTGEFVIVGDLNDKS